MNDINPAISRRNVLTGAAAIGAVPIIGATAAHAEEDSHGSDDRRVPPDIRAMLREINARNIERTITKLV